MDQQRKILANRTIDNDPEAVFQVVAPYGSNVQAARSQHRNRQTPTPCSVTKSQNRLPALPVVNQRAAMVT